MWETERPFELHLEKGIVSGRADVILDMENGKINRLALMDYKTAKTQDDDVFAFQLAVSAQQVGEKVWTWLPLISTI
jgi:DNA helicase-2/ATP-dependent DNA helicase PcrA